jgi:hypothetical protein
MKGIYLTPEGKQEIEAKIAELYRESRNQETINKSWSDTCTHKAFLLEEILQSATILPVEESWEDVEFSIEEPFGDLAENYSNGVIIQPKQ